MSIKEKIETICREIYGAKGVNFNIEVIERMKKFENDNLGHLPICMAKTHLSLSDNPRLKGYPKNFVITIQDLRVSAGAGFIYPIAGSMMTMPGLPPVPSACSIEIDEYGKISGLF
jgi:formate--tetrahydrofolate ligase